MKIKKEKIFLVVNTFLGFLLGVFTWDKLVIPYKDVSIIGIYSENNYHALNDVLRYSVVILLPSFAFLLTKYFFDKSFFIKLKKIFQRNNFEVYENKKISSYFIFLLISLLIFEFLSIDFSYHEIDTYHEGQRLSAAYKSLIDGSLWSGSYVTVGIFYEILSSKIIWKLLDHVSIGSVRFFDLFLILILKLLLLTLLYQIVHFLKINVFYQKLFLIFNIFFINQVIDYDLTNVSLISFREIPIILLAIFFILMLRVKNNSIILVLISLLSISSALWGVDRGLVCNFLILMILFYFIFSKDYKSFIKLSSFIFLSWLIVALYLDKEFFYFTDNTISILKTMPYVHGLIHPPLFSSENESFRASKTILVILLTLLLSINAFFLDENKYSNNLKKIFFFISVACVAGYIYALGRSDTPHIKQTFGLPLFFISIFIFYNLIFYLKKKVNFDNSVILIFLLSAIFFNSIKIENIKNYNSRLIEFLFKKDEFFLNKDERFFVEKAKPLVKEYKCIQLFSNDSALNYLLRKKSCTKYYFVWSASPMILQKKFIDDLVDTKLIIKGGRKNNWDLPLEKKLNLVNSYIDSNFLKKEELKYWELFLRKNKS